jgi:hypothetical protein
MRQRVHQLVLTSASTTGLPSRRAAAGELTRAGIDVPPARRTRAFEHCIAALSSAPPPVEELASGDLEAMAAVNAELRARIEGCIPRTWQEILGRMRCWAGPR